MYTTKNIALIAMATALIVAMKYAFGFVPAVEVVTFLVVLYGVFFPLIVSSTINICFVLLTGVIYGMGYWWIMYWFIFPIEGFLSWLFRKFLKKNNIIFALWTGFWAFSIMFWYALQDLVMQGPSLAIVNMSTAVLTNSIEGITNFLIALFMFYPSKKLFKIYFKKQEVNIW